MLNNISLGTYYPGNSLLHRLQARTKLLAILWIVVWLIIANQRFWHFAPYIWAALLLCISVALARISPRTMWKRMQFLLWLTIISSLTLLFSKETDARTFYPLGPFATSNAFVSTFLLVSLVLVGLLFVASILPLALTRPLRQRPGIRSLRVLLVLGLIVLLIAFWLVGGNPAHQPFVIGPFNITYGGIWNLMTFSMVVLALYGFSLLLTMTTTPIALIEGMTLLLAPLRRLHLPVDTFALMTLLALRFVPTLMDDIQQLAKAQFARGADMTRGTLRERIQSLSMLFLPLMHGVFRRAADLATALEARDYETDGKQTLLHETSLQTADYAMLAIVVVTTVAVLFV